MPAQGLAYFEAALESLGGALVTGGPDSEGLVPLDAYLGAVPPEGAVTARLAAAAAAAGVESPAVEIVALPARDWVAESERALPPVRAGRFWIYGAHVAEAPPPAALALRIEASTAFGTGRHESTLGCLLALGELARRRRPRGALDMGCGSGILALAMVRLWPLRVLAVDNDPGSVAMARANARCNGAGMRIRAVCGEGYRDARVAHAGPYDLVTANILAGPLAAMAPDLARHLAPGGVAILSGLLGSQERQVLAAHRAAGLRLQRRLRLGEWSTLLVAKGRARG